MENEEVVKHVLNSEECKLGRFRLAPRNEVLPSWPRRGLIDSLGIFVSALFKFKNSNHICQMMLAPLYDVYQAKMLQMGFSFLVLLKRTKRQLGKGG